MERSTAISNSCYVYVASSQRTRYIPAIGSSIPHADILDAARRVFSARGYAETTVERIAEEAGVSRVTLHRRSISKDGLLAELVERATEDYRRALWPTLTAEGSGAERLTQALEAHCALAEEHMGLLLALRAQANGVFHEEDSDEALTRSIFTEPLERILRDGIADGSLRTVDPEETATVLFNLVGWTYVHLRTGHRWSPERAARAVLEPTLHGVLAEPPECPK